MFLRATKRFKDGKVHLYWSMVENVRVGRRVFQRRALYTSASESYHVVACRGWLAMLGAPPRWQRSQ